LIIVDSNEAAESSSLVDSLRKVTELAVRPLEAGDYLIVGKEAQALVERKKVFDFLNSLKGRLWDQLTLLSSFEGEKTLLLEGYLALYRKRKWNEASILAMMDKIIHDWKIPIMYTPDVRATLAYLAWKDKRLGAAEPMREYPLRVRSRDMTVSEQALYTLEGLCGHETSKALLRHFGTLGRTVGFFQNDLATVSSGLKDVKVGGRRIAANTVKRIFDVVNYVYQEGNGEEDKESSASG